MRQLHAGLNRGQQLAMQNLFTALRTYCVSHWVPCCLGSKCCCAKKLCRPRGVEMIGVLQRGVKKEARAIEELLRSTDLFEKDAVQRT